MAELADRLTLVLYYPTTERSQRRIAVKQLVARSEVVFTKKTQKIRTLQLNPTVKTAYRTGRMTQ